MNKKKQWSAGEALKTATQNRFEYVIGGAYMCNQCRTDKMNKAIIYWGFPAPLYREKKIILDGCLINYNKNK